MKPLLPAFLLSVGLSAATVTPAVAYPVDCAILLCLAGGWPASAECAHARAVFIRRITPWPIEPPLQIWNCPMRASFSVQAQPMDRLVDIALRAETPALISKPEEMSGLLRIQDAADVDISDPAFDFVRSIRVFEITYQQHRNSDGDCSPGAPFMRAATGNRATISGGGATPQPSPRHLISATRPIAAPTGTARSLSNGGTSRASTATRRCITDAASPT